MKDLLPEKKLGSFFSKRIRLTQTLNVTISLALAITLDFVKKKYPSLEITAYSCMFIAGGAAGLLGTYLLAKTPEPLGFVPQENMVKLFTKTFADKNFRNFLIFNSFWAFALSIAAPFFSVFMMKTLLLPLTYIISFAVLGQLAGIAAVKFWGRYADQYSNKTIFKIAAPVYIFCIISWACVGAITSPEIVLFVIALINIVSAIATSGINLSLTNIGFKLAVKKEAVVYFAVKNIVIAFIAALGPLLGGYLADYFSKRSFTWKIEWSGPAGNSMLRVFSLHNLTFLFLISAVAAFLSLRLVPLIKEEGEISRAVAYVAIKRELKHNMRKASSLSFLYFPLLHKKIFYKKIREVKYFFIAVRKAGNFLAPKKFM